MCPTRNADVSLKKLVSVLGESCNASGNVRYSQTGLGAPQEEQGRERETKDHEQEDKWMDSAQRSKAVWRDGASGTEQWLPTPQSLETIHS